MVTRVHKHRKYWQNNDGKVLEIEGRQELSIGVSITGQRYEDWININSYEGEITIKGCHVEDLVNTILRFSSRKMRNHYKEMLDVIDLSNDNPLHQPKPFHPYDVECEKERKEHIKEWTNKREKDINQYLLEMSEEKVNV
jgi:hypothetical protein